MIRLEKHISFLDKMVKMVFYSTFIFAILTIAISYIKNWEQLLITLTERWFTVMVGELVVTGLIQISKDVIQAVTQYIIAKKEKEDNTNV